MPPSSIVGKSIFDLTEPNQRTYVQRALEASFGGALISLRHSFRDASGQPIEAVSNFYPDRGGSEERALYRHRAIICQTNTYTSEQTRRSRAGLPPPSINAPAVGFAPMTNTPAPLPLHRQLPIPLHRNATAPGSMFVGTDKDSASVYVSGDSGETFQTRTSTFKTLVSHPSQMVDRTFSSSVDKEDSSWSFDIHSLRLQVRFPPFLRKKARIFFLTSVSQPESETSRRTRSARTRC
jgi:hypothetical protein